MADQSDSKNDLKPWSSGWIVRFGFITLSFLLLLDFMVSYSYTSQVYQHTSNLAKSYEISESLVDLLSTMKDVETAQLAFLAADKNESLAPFVSSLAASSLRLDRLRELSANSPDLNANFRLLQEKTEARLKISRQIVRLRDEQGFKAAQDYAYVSKGKQATDGICTLIEELRMEERRTQLETERITEQCYFHTVTANILGVMLVIVFVGAAFDVVRRELTAHRHTIRLHQSQSEWLRVTLTSISEGVIATDNAAIITFLNSVAGKLTGWNQDAVGRQISDVFQIVNEASRQPIDNLFDRVLREGKAVGPTTQPLLITRSGNEIPIDERGAPIRDHRGRVNGVVFVFRDISKQKGAEDALRRSERALFDFFDNAKIGLNWVGPDGTILMANTAELALLGYASDEYIGHSITEFHVDPSAIAEIFRRLEGGEILNDFEARLRCKDGSIRYVLINFSVLWSQGEFVRTRCFTRDITAHKIAEDALRASELRYRRLFESSRQALLILDSASGMIIDVNAFVTEFTGYSHRELVGTSIGDVGLFEHNQAVLSELSNMVASRKILHQQVSIRTKANNYAEAECVAVVYDLADRTFIQLSLHDITSRVLAEEALRTARDRFRSVVDHVIHGIISIDDSGVIESVNPAAERLFGYQAAEIVGKNVKCLMPELYHTEYDAYLSNYLQTGHAKFIGIGREVVGLRKDRTTFPMELSVSAFPLGTRHLFTGIVQDITERKRLEEELRERVDQLRDADRRKSEFLAMLAHELRNPLAPIQNAVQLLRKNCPADAETTWAHDVIERQVQHMKRMVDDLLDVSRITRGLIKLQKERLDMATIVARALEMTQPIIDARNHELIVSLPAEPLPLEADLPRLAQVLANLLNNAAKYTEDKGTIWLTAERTENEVVVRVRDTGIGIPAEYLPRVFDLFSQEDSSLERTHGGLGIGLTLVRVLVRMHGGTIEAKSGGAGQGSEFVMRLPARSAFDLHEMNPQPSKSTDSAPVPLTRRRILVVDDNVDGANSLSILLRQVGHDVRIAHDGFAALELARTYAPEIVLLDIGMPQMSGLEVARRLRNELGLTGALLIAMTGYGQVEDRHRSRTAGFNVHMIKPLDLDSLQTIIARARCDDWYESSS